MLLLFNFLFDSFKNWSFWWSKNLPSLITSKTNNSSTVKIKILLFLNSNPPIKIQTQKSQTFFTNRSLPNIQILQGYYLQKYQSIMASKKKKELKFFKSWLYKFYTNFVIFIQFPSHSKLTLFVKSISK